MTEYETRDWQNEESRQIAVCKTDKALLELCDSLKPASPLFPAHIHAMAEKAENGERSLVRLNMLDYSNGTGGNTISVYANISPEEVRYIYSALFNHLLEFEFSQDKIFGIPDSDGYSIVTKLQISRYETDKTGEKRNYPWFVEIQNGKGIEDKNANGGKYCRKKSYIKEKSVRMFLSERDMFVLFAKAEAYVRVFEQEYAFRKSRVGNFSSLYYLLNEELQKIYDQIRIYGEREGALKKQVNKNVTVPTFLNGII